MAKSGGKRSMMEKKKVWVVNGPNLNLLGTREPEIYGHETLKDLEEQLTQQFIEQVEFTFFQSNHEGQLIDWLQQSVGHADLVLLNPAAYTHTSLALADALAAITTPVIEVHISNPASRQDLRRVSLTAPFCIASIAGFGLNSYQFALSAWLNQGS
jgi:3-dehydroquinate dehydratase-2